MNKINELESLSILPQHRRLFPLSNHPHLQNKITLAYSSFVSALVQPPAGTKGYDKHAQLSSLCKRKLLVQQIKGEKTRRWSKHQTPTMLIQSVQAKCPGVTSFCFTVEGSKQTGIKTNVSWTNRQFCWLGSCRVSPLKSLKSLRNHFQQKLVHGFKELFLLVSKCILLFFNIFKVYIG